MMWLMAMFCFGLVLPAYGAGYYGRPAPPPAPMYYRPSEQEPYAENYPEDLSYKPMLVVHYYYYTPYGYYGNEETFKPVEDPRMELHDDVSRGARADALPVGQETWFKGDWSPNRNDYDEKIATFFQNLMMTQNDKYDDPLEKSSQSEEYNERDVRRDADEYEERRNNEYYRERDTRDFEDEDVSELKALAGKPLYHVPKTSVRSAVNTNDPARRSPMWRAEDEHHAADDYQNDEGWINWGSKRSPKSSKVDAIKKNTENKGRIQKRYITTEEDLVGELKGLKRRSVA